MTPNDSRSILKLWLVLSCVSINGCSSQQAVGLKTHALEQNANNTMQAYVVNPATTASHEQLHKNLQLALAHFQRLDDPAGQWRIEYLAAQHALGRHDLVELKRHTDAMQRLGARLAPATVAYANAIMRGHTEPLGPYYARALELATSDLERAVALTYLGRHDEAMALMAADLTDSPASRAFVYYRFALATQSGSAFEEALRYYQRAQDTRGIADTLIRLARLAADDHQTAKARAYAERAASVLKATGDTTRAKQIDAWLVRL